MPREDSEKFLQAGLVSTIIIVLLGVIVFQKLVYEQIQPVASRYEVSEQKQRADTRIKNECVGLDGISLAKCEGEIEQAARGSYQSAKDLKAQRYMAAWAFFMVATSILGLAITAIGLYFIYRTLQASEAATKSANEAIQTTIDVGRDQSRAYVHADKVLFFWGGKNHTTPRVEIWVRNTGQTPAKWYEIRMAVKVYDHKKAESINTSFSDVELPVTFSGKWNSIPPDAEGTKATFFLLEERQDIERALIRPFVNPSHGFSIVGEIRYCTFFDEVFISQFCFGRSSLPEYETLETKTRIDDSIGLNITVNENIEKPIPLARYAFDLETYQRVDGQC